MCFEDVFDIHYLVIVRINSRRGNINKEIIFAYSKEGTMNVYCVY